MNKIKNQLAQTQSINEAYALLSQYLQNTLKNSVCILVQLDEKQDESFVYDLVGLKAPVFYKLIHILGLNPVGKRFKNTPFGRKHFFSSNGLSSFEGNLSEFSESAVPDWICSLIESIFNIKNIYTIGLHYENVSIGSVMIFSRMGDAALFQEIEENIPFFSKRMKEIIDTYKQDVLGFDTRDHFTKTILNNISHEIRTPLNCMIGPMDFGLRLLNENENTRDLASIISKSSSELTDKLDKLLILSDFQTNGTHIHPRKLSVNDITIKVEDIVRNQRSANKDRTILLNINLDELTVPFISIDLFNFELTIVELINNALKFSEKDLSINVSGNKVLKIEVCDEGIGMSEKEIIEYTKAFNRTPEISEKYIGMGIGLSIVKSIVKEHNWRISFNSTLGKGTAVSLFLEEQAVEDSPLNTHSNLVIETSQK
jgi:signal transduction histidine kinase